MAEMRPPPPRYRIVEHKGRLIATDTWAENRPARAEVSPPRGDTPLSRSVTPLPRSDKPLPRVSGSPRSIQPRGRPEPTGGGIDALGAALVVAVCGGSTDPAGRPILKTLNYFDINGPREIALSPASAQTVGRCLSVILAVAVSGIILACLFPGAFIVLAILIGFSASAANTAARPQITRWLDRLGES
ncbi:MAG: hypothetical protein ABIS51_12020 [Sphingomonas sp.]|jgi:hypothetical protein